MRLIVGLGNVGEKYDDTRHNIGFVVIDILASKLENSKNPNFQESKKLKSEIIKIGNLILAKPITFMNSSGEAVAALSTFYKIQPTDLYVVHDDLDIKLGQYKVQLGIGPKVHGGVNSIEEKLGNEGFWRVRVGVENRNPENRISGDEYVMGKFTEDELVIRDEVVKQVVEDLVEKLKISY